MIRIQELLAARGCAVSHTSLWRFIWKRNWGRRGIRTVRMADTEPGEVAEADQVRVTWEKHKGGGHVDRHRGFTPTHVGKAPWPSPGPPSFRVHPHARGESRLRVYDGDPNDGSPPRTWGKRADDKGYQHQLRFTPTHVGKATILLMVWEIQPVHPHARGESEAR